MAFQKLKDRFNALAAPIVNLTAKQAAHILMWQALGLFVLNGAILKTPMNPVKLTLLEMALQGAFTGALMANSFSRLKKEAPGLKETAAETPEGNPAAMAEETQAAAPAQGLRAYFREQAADAKAGVMHSLQEMKTPAKVGAILTYGAMSLLSIGMSFPGK